MKWYTAVLHVPRMKKTGRKGHTNVIPVYERDAEGYTHMKWYICMPAINHSDCKAVSCHCTMNGTMCEQCAIDIVWCIAWNSTDHVSWIYIKKGQALRQIPWHAINYKLTLYWRSKQKMITYVFNSHLHLLALAIILQSNNATAKNCSEKLWSNTTENRNSKELFRETLEQHHRKSVTRFKPNTKSHKNFLGH